MKRALISTYYKDGIEILAKNLTEKGWEIISTGGTAKYLQESGFKVQEVADLTDFPEILDGRVKTLHPLIFAGILAKRTPDHLQQLDQFHIPEIDLVAVNFYPFEEALNNRKKGLDYMIENIDIGGPSMVRAAAKNFKNTIVIVDKEDYIPVSDILVKEGDLDLALRKQLAQKAFSYTSFYDSLIATYLHEGALTTPVYFNLAGRKQLDLRYGENPHQQGSLYIRDNQSPLAHLQKLQGKELSFNNILDFSMVYEALNQFNNEKPFAMIVKHQNPCGAAIGNTLEEAFTNAFAGDPKSAFGGIVGFNKPMDKGTAGEVKNIFFEVIIAPDYHPEALDLLKKKKNLRIVKIPMGYTEKIDTKTIPGGFVYQEKDNATLSYDKFTLKTSRKPSKKEQQDIEFGWKLIKYVKSNAIILVKDQTLIGVGAGQMSRVDAVELAIKKSEFPLQGATLISDAFFPFADSIEIAANYKIAVAVEPGGSIRDDEVITAAEKHNMSLLFTGMRHFRH